MSTVIGFECSAGAVVAGDRLAVSGGRVVSRSVERIFAYTDLGLGPIGAAVVGGDEDRGAVEDFDRQFESRLREYSHQRERIDRETALRIASDVAADAGAAAVLAACDADGEAGIGAIYSDGSTTEDAVVALGRGAELALGGLEAAERAVDVDSAAALARETLQSVAERDPGTGAEADVWTLESAGE